MFRCEIWHYPLMSRSGSQSCHCIYPSLSSPVKITLSVWDAEITGVRWHKLSEILTSSGNITILSGSNLRNILQQWLLYSLEINLFTIIWVDVKWSRRNLYNVHPLIGPLTFLFVSQIPERLTLRSIFVRCRSVFTQSLFTSSYNGLRITPSCGWERGNLNAREMLPGWRSAQDWKPGSGQTLKMRVAGVVLMTQLRCERLLWVHTEMSVVWAEYYKAD